jgi:hypothetical protein
MHGDAAHGRREMTEDEHVSWAAAQQKISKHWQSSLGLRPLPSHPDILVASGFLDEGGPIAGACRWDA